MTPDSKKKTTAIIAAKKKVATKTAVSAKEAPAKKVTNKTTAKPKDTTKKKVAKKSTTTSKPQTSDERWKMIAIAAYHKAEQRGFAPGSELQDWAEAEKEVDELLMSG